jgi:hypothetical protein
MPDIVAGIAVRFKQVSLRFAKPQAEHIARLQRVRAMIAKRMAGPEVLLWPLFSS